MLRKSLQHLCTSLEIEKALGDVGLPATVCIIVLCQSFISPFFFFHKKGPLVELFVCCKFLSSIYLNVFLQSFMQSRPEELTLDDFVKLHNLIVQV